MSDKDREVLRTVISDIKDLTAQQQAIIAAYAEGIVAGASLSTPSAKDREEVYTASTGRQ